jgi:hypothetical protein
MGWGERQQLGQYAPFNEFDEANIEGKISWLGRARKGVAFRIENHSTAFVFWPRSSPDSPAGPAFTHVAEVGYTILKPAHSDVIVVVDPRGVEYEFSFHRIAD